MRVILPPALLLLVFFLLPATASAWQAEVVEVKDARTLLVQTNGESRTVFLYGIGVPEGEEPYARQAESLVTDSVGRKEVNVQRLGSGQKIKALVYAAGREDSLNEELLASGLAWVHDAYCEKARLCGRLEQIEAAARKEGKGLWAEVPENMPAWKWVREADN